MKAIGRGVAATMIVGCVALAGTSRSVAETLDEQPIAVPEQQAAPTPTPVESTTGEPLAVRGVHIESSATGRRLVVALTRQPDSVQDFQLTAPPRVVVDLRGPLAGRVAEARYPVVDRAVERVRVARYEGQLRIVVDLKNKGTVTAVRQDGTTLVAELAGGPTPPVKTAAKEPEVAPTPAIDPQGTSEPTLAAMVDTPANTTPAPDIEAVEVPTPVVPAAAPTPEAPPARRATAHARPTAPVPARAFAEIGDSGPTTEPVAYYPDAEPVRAQPARLAAARANTLAPAPEPPQFSGQKISLDFKDADIQNVLRVLADVSGLNIIATDDVQGKVTLHLSDVPWDQAFDLVLRTNRLEKTREGNVVRVSSVKRLTEERDSLKAANESETQLEPLRVKYIRVNYARADEALVDKVKGVLSDRGAVTFDDRTNTIIIRDIERGIEDSTRLIKELDIQSPQVLIEANLVEATQDFARGLGIQWGYRYVASPETGNPTGYNFPGRVGVGGSGLGDGVPGVGAPGVGPGPVPFLASFPVPGGFGSGFGPNSGSALDLALGSLDGTQSVSARITALENDGKAKVISRPRVITMNNVAATIQSLTILRVKLPSTGTVISTGGGGAAGASTATEKINTGITLVVTPQISSDGYVLMNIYAKSSLPDFTRSVDGIPSEISREANSNVLIRNGDTVVLGGIYRHQSDDREDGLPYLSKIPALGWLFRRTLETKHHEELLVFLTPKIIETGTASLPPAERLWSERRGG